MTERTRWSAPSGPHSRPAAGPLARLVPVPTPPPTEVVAAAGSAIVTAARIGRILGRSGWRIARQLPGAQTLERGAQRLQQGAVSEVRRRLDQSAPGRPTAPESATDEERRAVLLVQHAGADEAPLRTAMSELLQRSVEADRRTSREYLFGTIMSQLVPDEARILAALADGRSAATVDVVIKLGGRGRFRVESEHLSTVGRLAGLSGPGNTASTAIYLTRLHGFGLVRFGPPDDRLDTEYELLATDPDVQAARTGAAARRFGAVRLMRGTVALSPLGREFWAAADPVAGGAAALPPGEHPGAPAPADR